ncbi:SMI1/KNR4 family protein [Aliikangiella coralliicola]|uniref:SMI1/KNR4 family protein n=1 Tax=Aliikangiella coralliicola TaxID=2592383 RepID=A0A545UI17_9GAMM|nr:SMI1/KNR4 family protein [Aliikangiella coralliicola]TQV89110.1 SMI1/KNR4 family protein [Aliikangiella coralliicola]
MSEFSCEEVKKLINLNLGIIELGTSKDAVDVRWFEEAEKILGVKLTESYLWFLRNYSGGEIGGEEIYSIYGVDFETVNGGDIVYHHIVNQRSGLTKPDHIVVLETDLGEVFFFDYSEFDGKECPINLRLPSGDVEHYAKNFYEFLQRRIEVFS